MSNMSYCRFENTYRDLSDVAQHINDKLSESEINYRKQLVETCALILDELGLEHPSERDIEKALDVVVEEAAEADEEE